MSYPPVPDCSPCSAGWTEIWEFNANRVMPYGERFTGPEHRLPGWRLELLSPIGADAVVVESGNTLRDIAGDRYGDPLRWPSIFEANRAHALPDGDALTDPA